MPVPARVQLLVRLPALLPAAMTAPWCWRYWTVFWLLPQGQQRDRLVTSMAPLRCCCHPTAAPPRPRMVTQPPQEQAQRHQLP